MRVALVVAGAYAGEPHRRWYYEATRSTADRLRQKGYRVAHLFPEALEGVDGPSKAGVLLATLRAMAEAAPELLLLFAVGHGRFDPGRGESALQAADREVWASEIRQALGEPHGTQLLIFTPCQSGGFQVLGGPGRLVITSTGPREDNEAPFAEALRDALFSEPSVAAAFRSARDQVEAWYRAKGLPSQEHPILSDHLLAEALTLGLSQSTRPIERA